MDEKNIVEVVDEKIREVRTKSLDVSFNEILDMFKSKELIIEPEYQRLFRWNDQKQSQFIESIILELPLPPIFFVENDNGTYELIDGLQRISTYLKFRGELPNPNKEDENLPMTVLKGCDILKDINGCTFDDLSPSIRLKLKRNFIRAEVLKNQTDREMRYHMFKRLNTGGELLTPQEVRNCTIRILGNDFINFIKKLTKTDDFANCLSAMATEDKNRMGDEECILRFFAIKNDLENYDNTDFQGFLDTYLEKVTKTPTIFDYCTEELLFKKTFKILNCILGPEIFKNQGINRFSRYQYEAITIGIQSCIDKISIDNSSQIEKIKNAIIELKEKNEYKDAVSGSFLFKKDKIISRIELVKSTLEGVLE